MEQNPQRVFQILGTNVIIFPPTIVTNSNNDVMEQSFQENNEIIKPLQHDFKENLELLNESWYIGDNRGRIKEIRNIYNPKTHKYITIEDRLIKE